MAQKTMSIMDRLRLDANEAKKLKDLDDKLMTIGEENKKDISAYTRTVGKILDGKEDIKVEDLSKLDKGIERGKQYQAEISDLAESLSGELTDLGQFFGDMNQYKGLEKARAWMGWNRKADKMRLGRVKNQDVKQNLQTILDYGTHMVSKLQNAIYENMECHSKIDGTIQDTAGRLEQNQPLYEASRAKREGIERDLAAVIEKSDKSEAGEFAKLAKQRAKLEKELQEAKVDENYLFTIVDKSKKALPVQRQHLQSYADIFGALIQIKTGLEQNIENVTNIYLSVPTAIKTALSTKAASKYDAGLNYATEKSTEVVLSSAAGIMEEVANRAEKQLIDPDKLEIIKKAAYENRRDFENRISAIKAQYAKSAVPTE